jgi:hypothetical protein
MADTFLEFAPSALPNWLKGFWGVSWSAAHGLILDGIAQGATDAVKCRIVTRAPDDAIPKIGKERNIPRYSNETVETYRNRLQDAWNTWAKAGTDKGILDQITLIGFSDATIVRNNQWDWDSNPGNVATYWARFWVVLPTWPYNNDGYWGDAGYWGDGGSWGTEAPTTICKALIDAVRKWKSSHAACIQIICIVDGGVWGYPIDETWGSGTWDASQVFRLIP